MASMMVGTASGENTLRTPPTATAEISDISAGCVLLHRITNTKHKTQKWVGGATKVAQRTRADIWKQYSILPHPTINRRQRKKGGHLARFEKISSKP
jgi:hypothetical protein